MVSHEISAQCDGCIGRVGAHFTVWHTDTVRCVYTDCNVRFCHIVSAQTELCRECEAIVGRSEVSAGSALLVGVFLRTFIFLRKLADTPEGRDVINKKFKLCTNLTKPEDQNELAGLLFLFFCLAFILFIFFRLSNGCVRKFGNGQLSVSERIFGSVACLSRYGIL